MSVQHVSVAAVPLVWICFMTSLDVKIILDCDDIFILDDPQYDVFVFVMRCLPILALIAAFIWLYYLGTKAQQNTSGTG